jgi:predicted nucleotidyltransferase
MDLRGPDTDVLADLERVLCGDPAIEFVLVFGSRVTETTSQSSDLDIAIKFSPDLSESERFQRRCGLAGELQRDDAPFIDVADLDALPLHVAHDALDGQRLCGDPQAVADATANIETALAERGAAIRRRQRAVIDRIAEEGLRG